MHIQRLKRFICLFLVFTAALGCSQSAIPVTSDDVEAYLSNAERNIEETVRKIEDLTITDASFENTIEPLNRLASDLLENVAILTFISWTDLPSKARATHAVNELQAYYEKMFFKKDGIYNSIINYVANTSANGTPLTAYQRHQIQILLDSCDNLMGSLSKDHQQLLVRLKTFNKNKGAVPFNYVKGLAPEKPFSGNGFTILNLNTCCLPGNQTLFFGGVLPWKQRVSALGDKILHVDADVICLQEVFVEEAGYALYEKLKNNYSHFYMSIGPRVAGFSLETLGFPSGLFVASKYPVENPTFTPFTASALQMNYGFFDFTLPSLGHVYATHLVPMAQLAPVRALQLNQIIEKMEKDLKTADSVPFFLCGDLNIALHTGEPGEAIIKTHFQDAYNHADEDVDASNETCTNYFTNYFLSPDKNPNHIPANLEILDYALVLKDSKGRLKTRRVQMNDGVHPETALSDHHGLLTIVRTTL